MQEKAPLSRARVLSAALALLEREGGSALSMRRVAAELGAAPMSLYRHVEGKDDLVAGVVALALRETSTVLPEGHDWPQRARAWMDALRQEIQRRPTLQPLLRSHHLEAQSEALREALRACGFDSPEANRTAQELLHLTVGFAPCANDLFDSAAQHLLEGIRGGRS